MPCIGHIREDERERCRGIMFLHLKTVSLHTYRDEIMKLRLFIALLLASNIPNIIHGQISFNGNSLPVVELSPESGSGLNKIFVLHDLANVTISYQASSDGDATWFSFKEGGSNSTVQVNGISYNGKVSTLSRPQANIGYLVKDGSKQYCFWVVDYSKCQFAIRNISFPPEEQGCGQTIMVTDADCVPLTYYTTAGIPKQLSRDISITYNTLEWDSENATYNTTEVSDKIEQLGTRLSLTAPLCNTTYVVRGDRFQQAWNEEVVYTTDTYTTMTVDVNTTATQSHRDNANEQKTDTESLGGSAPADVAFKAYCTDAAVYKEWQFATDQEFEKIFLRLNEENVDYSFKENGTFYVKFIANNADGTCQSDSEIYTVSIGESALDCPNAFSPNATAGINDEWKVSYKSIISFHCWIFDRYGNQIIDFTNPAVGWDGKYKGKYVNPGVYYYVIEAKGADGKSYKLKGDINILKSKK